VTQADPVRWGLLGASPIAARSFLPALAVAGGGVPLVVGARDGARAERFASDHGASESVEGYRAVLEDPRVEAVYVALPNGLHAEWTIAALEAGKAVLCEKPMCATPEETRAAIGAARAANGLLWEAFVFPFHPQTARLRELLDAGAIGELREIRSSFHFVLEDDEVRMSRELAGGAMQDVGCYPIRLARLLFDAEPQLERTIADARWATTGVDVECWGALAFPSDRRLVFSCGFGAAYDPSAILVGTTGRIDIRSPFHPRPGATLSVITDGRRDTEPSPGTDEPSFTPALRHLHRAIRGLEPPQHLAVDEALGNAEAIAAILRTASRSSD
jgi:predicted dehydrogenase